MRNTIKKSIFPVLVFAHTLARFCMPDVAESKTDKGIDRANRVAVLMTEIENQQKPVKEEEQVDFLAVAVAKKSK